jgi:hypothetical protein
VAWKAHPEGTAVPVVPVVPVAEQACSLARSTGGASSSSSSYLSLLPRRSLCSGCGTQGESLRTAVVRVEITGSQKSET